MSSYSDFAGNVSDLLARQGENLGRAKAASGQNWGQAIATLGDRIPKQVQEAIAANQQRRKQAQIQSIFQQSGGDLGKAIPEIMALDPEMGTKLAKEYGESQKLAYDLAKLDHEYKTRRAEMGLSRLATAENESQYASALLGLKEAGEDISGLDPQFSPNAVQRANRMLLSAKERLELDKPKEPKYWNTAPGGKVFRETPEGAEMIAENPYQLTPDQQTDNERQAEAARLAAANQASTTERLAQQAAETARHNRAMESRPAGGGGGRPVAVLGPDGKTPILVPPGESYGRTPAPSTTARETTEDERKTAGFYTQMESAIKTMEEVEHKLTERELYQIQTLPQEGLIGMANRGQLSENAKRYLRAFEQFTEARLRPVSGAAIADSEFARDRRTYARQFSETPQLSKDRKEARRQALGTLKTRAGRAFQEPPTSTTTDSGGGEWIDAGGGIRIRKK